MNNFEETNLLFDKTYYNSTTFLNISVFILYVFHTLVNLFINLRPVIITTCKYSAGCLYSELCALVNKTSGAIASVSVSKN